MSEVTKSETWMFLSCDSDVTWCCVTRKYPGDYSLSLALRGDGFIIRFGTCATLPFGQTTNKNVSFGPCKKRFELSKRGSSPLEDEVVNLAQSDSL